MQSLQKHNSIGNLEPLVGSYDEDDCLFLLQEINAEYQTIENKERLIQSGEMHYSETISKEFAPSDQYTELFLAMTEKYKTTLASQIMRLATIVAKKKPDNGRAGQEPIVILSLARAGTPIGVLLKEALSLLEIESVHYSISIIRDIGIDTVALDYITKYFVDDSICFVDGWTAKGVIGKELRDSVEKYNADRDTTISPDLFVVSDIGGTADYSATYSDYAIPSALMNSTVSGLVSRTIKNSQTEGGFHGCVRYAHLESIDRSKWFIDQICGEMSADDISEEVSFSPSQIKEKASIFMKKVSDQYGVSDINRIKPGIAEATRVMLRRVPDTLIVKDIGSDDTAHLVQLAREKDISIVIDIDMPFGACALIKDVL
jgi:hypothetical protein